MLRAVLLSTSLVYVLEAFHVVHIQSAKPRSKVGDPFESFFCMWFGPHWFNGFIYSVYDRSNFVHERACDDIPGTQFLISGDQFTTIRPALRPDLCVEAPETLIGPSPLLFKPCSGFPNQTFSIPRHSTFYHYIRSHICMVSNPNLCLGDFQTSESCTLLYQTFAQEGALIEQSATCGGNDIAFFTGVIGISDITSFNVSSPTRTVRHHWHIITAHPDMWLGSRATEAFVFEGSSYYLIGCVAVYTIYVLKRLCKVLHVGQPRDIALSWLWTRLMNAKHVLWRICRGMYGLFAVGASSDDLSRLMERRRLQRAQVYSRRIFHLSSIYAVFKARQLWTACNDSRKCSDEVIACDASCPRHYIYSYEIFPLFIICYPAVGIITLLGERTRPWLCDMFTAILSVAWSVQQVFIHSRAYGFNNVKVLACRIVQLIILGNARLAAVFAALVDLSGKAYTYGVCSVTPRRPIDEVNFKCPSERTIWGAMSHTDGLSGVEVFILLFIAMCLYFFDVNHAKDVLDKSKANARELASGMLQRHLDVLYDCVVHLDESHKISMGAPKLAGLLMRGAINDTSLKDRHLADLLIEGDRQRFVEHMKQSSLTERISVLHVSFVDGCDGLVPCELFTSSAADAEGMLVYLLGIREIGDEIRAQPSTDIPMNATATAQAVHHEVEDDIDKGSGGPAGIGAHADEILELSSLPSEKSRSSASESEASQEELNMRLTVVWGVEKEATIVGCTRELSLALGKELEGSFLCDELQLDPPIIDNWFQESVNSWTRGLDTDRLQLLFKPCRWRPRMSAVSFIEEISPVIDMSRRLKLRLARLRMVTNIYRARDKPQPKKLWNQPSRQSPKRSNRSTRNLRL